MKLKKTLNTFNDRLQLLQKPGYVASSCNFKFELNPTDRLLADDEAKVEKLHDEVNIARVLFQGQMQAQIIALVKLEIASVQNAIRKSVAKSIVDITTTLALLDPTLEEGHNSDIFQFVLDTDTADLPSLLQHSEFQTKHKLYDLIHTFAQEQATATTPTDAYRPTEDRTYAVDDTSPTVILFLQISQAVFVTSWDTYLKQIALLENTKKVKAYLSASTAEKATQDTAMALADLDLNDPVTVKNVIDKSVACWDMTKYEFLRSKRNYSSTRFSTRAIGL
ncbi:unnamed protein product [Cylindrotheca closterium]|uniref:Uncharacterized protein n=1 Tax=Cylindrotheca closterium TaxID=2856 RepID=A0AAD2FKJ0_9STRA|nr:unnamed protein product [Cylindrotheca closterium]